MENRGALDTVWETIQLYTSVVVVGNRLHNIIQMYHIIIMLADHVFVTLYHNKTLFINLQETKNYLTLTKNKIVVCTFSYAYTLYVLYSRPTIFLAAEHGELAYRVLWLPPRYPVLISYVLLIVLLVFLLVGYLLSCKCFLPLCARWKLHLTIDSIENVQHSALLLLLSAVHRYWLHSAL